MTIKIGGVTFDKVDVKSSKVVVKDGKKINSVFLQDGTHVEFPNQAATNNSRVTQGVVIYETKGKSKDSYEYGYDLMTGGYGGHWESSSKKIKSKQKVTCFERMTDAKVIGTYNKDEYRLFGCCNTTVDVSQKDGLYDLVYDSNDHTESDSDAINWKHENNTFKLDTSDQAVVFKDCPFFNKTYDGKGTFNTGK